MNAVAPCVVSPEQLVDLVEVLLKLPLDVLQLVVVDGGVAPDADACCQLFFMSAPIGLFLQVVVDPTMPRLHKTAEFTRWQLHLMTSTPNAAHAFTTFPP